MAKVFWQKVFDIESEIEFLGEGMETGDQSREWFFKLVRRESEMFWDPEEDTVSVFVEDGKIVDFDYEHQYPNEVEAEAMLNILKEKNIL